MIPPWIAIPVFLGAVALIYAGIFFLAWWLA
jgi:hypothetical protein